MLVQMIGSLFRRNNWAFKERHNEKAPKFATIGMIVAAASVIGLNGGSAQPAAPTETKGVNIKMLEGVELGPQFEAMAGRH
jgi:hypothetical protein